MAEKIDRFEIVQRDPNGLAGPEIRVIVDKKTGVNYLFANSGYAGGMCVMVDAQGKPIVTPVSAFRE